MRNRITTITVLAGLLLPAFALSAADRPKSIESKTKIHRLKNAKRSVFDAFVYVNRIPDAPEAGEYPEDFAGRIFGRLANQEGRILLKLPPSMDRRAYAGFKTFLGSEGDAKVNNCVSCHSAPDFTDGKSHVVTKGGSSKPTPSLRDLKLSPTDLAKVIRDKIAASRLKKSDQAPEVAEAYSRMDLDGTDIPNLVAFLGTLKDVADTEFRELIIKAEVFDATQPKPVPPVVSGTVRLAGSPPQRKRLTMDPTSAGLYRTPPLDENVLTGKNGGLANVFVYAKRGVPRKTYPLPEQPAILDQQKSMYRPRLQGVRVGQKFIIRNSDPYIHNTRSLSLRNRAFNIGQPPRSADRERVFTRPEGPIRLGCDFHKWMAAWIFVLDHPYYAITDADGNFEIKDLPPGEYTFEAWHEEFGDQRQNLKIDRSQPDKLNFIFKPGNE